MVKKYGYKYIIFFEQSTRVSIDDASYANVRDPTKFVNGRQKTSISINSYNNHQIKPAMLSKARSRENIAASHGNLSMSSTNNLKDSSPSSRLYEFGYSYDNNSSQQHQKKQQPMYDHPNKQLQDHEMSTSVIKTSPRNHNERTKNPRGDSNSLSRKHLEMKRNATKDNNRQKEYKNASLELLQDGTKIPSPPTILPLLQQEEPNFEGEQTFQEQAVPYVREMAWTSLVDTATKATSHGGVKTPNEPIGVYTERDPQKKVSPSNMTTSRPPNSGLLQLSPGTLETDVTYFTHSNGPNEDLSDDDNDKTIMEDSGYPKQENIDTKGSKNVNINSSPNSNEFPTPIGEDLESEVVALRVENQRLQEESQTAAHQLRRFTEWFFQSSQPDENLGISTPESNAHPE